MRPDYEEKVSAGTAAADRPGLSAALDYLCAGTPSSSGSSTGSAARSGTCWPSPTTCTTWRRCLTLTGKLSGTYSPTSEGKFFFTMMAAFAELERDIIDERTMARLLAARDQGRRGGRPVVMDADKLAAARAP